MTINNNFNIRSSNILTEGAIATSNTDKTNATSNTDKTKAKILFPPVNTPKLSQKTITQESGSIEFISLLPLNPLKGIYSFVKWLISGVKNFLSEPLLSKEEQQIQELKDYATKNLNRDLDNITIDTLSEDLKVRFPKLETGLESIRVTMFAVADYKGIEKNSFALFDIYLKVNLLQAAHNKTDFTTAATILHKVVTTLSFNGFALDYSEIKQSMLDFETLAKSAISAKSKVTSESTLLHP